MFEPIGNFAPTRTGRRTGQPVRRNSYIAGRERGVFWRGIEREDLRKILQAAKRYELANRSAGQRSGPLGSVALEVLELFCNMVNRKTGQLDPSIDTLMQKLKRSRDAIARALKALRAHGFLDWLRRYVPTGNEGRGPQVQQTSNAYRLFLPAAAARLLGRLGLPVPLPDDVRATQDARKAEIEAHRSTLSLAELPLFDIDDPALAARLSRLGGLIDAKKERESARQTESLLKDII